MLGKTFTWTTLELTFLNVLTKRSSNFLYDKSAGLLNPDVNKEIYELVSALKKLRVALAVWLINPTRIYSKFLIADS